MRSRGSNADHCKGKKVGERKKADSFEAARRGKEASTRAQAKSCDTAKDVAQRASGRAVTDTEGRGESTGHAR
jgi:hypothetical protein